jgi:RNA polymerase sigma factor (sigma-70 family)
VSRLNDFWSEHYDELRSYAMSLTPYGEDLLQDIYIRLSELPEFEDVLDGNPAGYVCRCLQMEVNSSTSRFHYKYRKDYARDAAHEINHRHNTEYDYDWEEKVSRVEEVARELGICELKVLQIIYKRGVNMKQISKDTGIPYKEIKRLRDNGKEEIRKGLGRFYRTDN